MKARNPFLAIGIAMPAIALAISLTASPSAAVPDTLWVDNTGTCPGNGGKTTPYCRIRTALTHFAGGSNWIIAIQPGVYREWVQVEASDSGSVANPLKLIPYLGTGTVVIDGSDQQASWTQHSGNIWRAKVVSDTFPIPSATAIHANATNQVYMNGVRYMHLVVGADTTVANLPVGRCVYLWAKDSVYVNFGSNPYTSGDTGYVSLRKTIQIGGASNVTVSGLIARRSNDDGVGITSAKVRNVTISDCKIEYSQNQGLMFSKFPSHHCTVEDCDVRYSVDHGIYVVDTLVQCTIRRNKSAYNDDPTVDRGGANGIRIGDHSMTAGFDSAYVSDHLVELNEVWGNEDSGIEYRVNNVTSRYNRSWRNGDHGYDHLYCVGVSHVGDLSVNNDRSGMSFEYTGWRHSLRNCVIANNGRDVNRKDYEIELDCSAATVDPHPLQGFTSDYNVIWRDGTQAADSIAIAVANINETPQTNNAGCDVYATCYGRNQLVRFKSDYGSFHGVVLEPHSTQMSPAFTDSASGNFIPTATSAAIDAADVSVTGYVATDARGFYRHDYGGTANTGAGSIAYADIGPYEFDIPPGAPTIEADAGKTSIAVAWTERGDDGDVTTAFKHRLYIDNVAQSPVDALTPGSPACESKSGLTSCTSYAVKVLITEFDNNQSAWSNVVNVSTDCGGNATVYCSGDGFMAGDLESSSNRVEGGAVDGGEIDYPLSLSEVWPNPARGPGSVTFAIPRAMAGSAYELAMFDVTGRRVATLEKGAARAGRHTHEVLGAKGGRLMSAGVYFLRLRIANEVMTRTVFLTP